MTTPVTSVLARFAAELRWDDVPEPARRATRRTFANSVGLAVGASGHEAVVRASGALDTLGWASGPHALCTVLGTGRRVTGAAASLLNGMAAHVEDFDDTHLRTVLHPGAPIVPAAIAAGELVGATGQQVLTAVAAGVEVASKVGNGLGQSHFDRGWHVTGTVGHLGAAAAAGSVLGLDPVAMGHALAIASTEAAGVTEQLGTMTKSFHPGKAAADGLEAALLAREGFTGPVAAIEGRRGLAHLLAVGADLDEMVRDLGVVWEIEHNAFKPYSCGIVSHPVIDAAIRFRDAGVTEDRIASVEVRVRPVVLEVMGVADPHTGLESKFSVYHCFAVGLLYGGAGPAQFSDVIAVDPVVDSVRKRVRAVLAPDMPKESCEVEVVDTSGRHFVERVENATGSIAAPMSDDQLRSKFRLVSEPVLGDGWTALWDACIALDAAPDLERLTRAARTASSVASSDREGADDE